MDDNTAKRGLAASEHSDNEESSDEEEDMTYYEESSESEPELECDLWDIDCKILQQAQPTKSVLGCHLMATCANDPLTQPKKKLRLQPNLRTELTELSFMENFKNCWSLNTPICNNHLEVITSPFKVCVVKNLLENVALLDELRKELYEICFNFRNMDLYEFFQSKDLKYLTSTESICGVYDFLKNDMMKWVASITGFDLTHMSATCSLYSNTDYLLVHDDQREDRRVAFILYLTDEYGWDTKDGGTLQLFSKDENGQPLNVVRELVPQNNQMVFFPVTNDSYHQVAEVVSLNKYRLSINGWFHTKVPPVFKIPLYQPLENSLYSQDCRHSKVVDIDLETWIREDYLNSKTIKLIQRYIEENSEISLKEFFRNETFIAVLDSLQSNDLSWKKVSPINRYCYEIADSSTLPHIIERLLDLFQSSQMFHLLQKYTELELDTSRASMKFELQRWSPGSYALLTDYDWKDKNELDLIMYFGCKNSKEVIGARTHYVTIEDEVQNALITIEPEQNNLNIIYRDSARFTKYFSKQSHCQCFYVLICSYSE